MKIEEFYLVTAKLSFNSRMKFTTQLLNSKAPGCPYAEITLTNVTSSGFESIFNEKVQSLLLTAHFEHIL
jgi:hypothetical protein